jgi:hypothetical protein
MVLLRTLRGAQNHLGRIVESTPVHNNLAHTLLALKDYEQALVSARMALSNNPTLPEARQHEAQALAGLNQLKSTEVKSQ